MMGLFLLVIFTQATRAGNNSKAETFPLGWWDGAAVPSLVAVAHAAAIGDGAVPGQDGARCSSPSGCCATRSVPTSNSLLGMGVKVLWQHLP